MEAKQTRVVLEADLSSLVMKTDIRGWVVEADSGREIRIRNKVLGGSGRPTPFELLLISAGSCVGISIKSLVSSWRVGEKKLSDFLSRFQVIAEGTTEIGENFWEIKEISITVYVEVSDEALPWSWVDFAEKAREFATRWSPVTGLISKTSRLRQRLVIKLGDLEKQVDLG